MAKLTWLGTEDYREGETPLESCEWNGVLFTAFDKVEVTDEWMIAKARGNRFFRVENGNEPAPLPETWTNNPPVEEPRYPTTPPDYPPEDEPGREPNKKRGGRPRRIRDNGDGE